MPEGFAGVRLECECEWECEDRGDGLVAVFVELGIVKVLSWL